MRWSTPIDIKATQQPIDYNSRIFSIGSCFAVNIAEKLSYFKFENSVNPFGILFHPLAIDEVLHRTVTGELYTDSDLFLKDGLWHSYEVHSSMNCRDRQEMISRLNSNLASTINDLQKASHIIITYGTAWVYRELQSMSLVANCHKVPAANFRKEILSADIIEAAVENTINTIRGINPSAQMIFTISPVRHLKDGAVENQRSKSNLFSGLHQAIDSKDKVSYFPSYEIMMDELRDYRFYASDMLHPSQVAIDYIWERFVDTQFDKSSFDVMKQISSIQKLLSHRPFNDDLNARERTLEQLQDKIAQLHNKYSHIKF